MLNSILTEILMCSKKIAYKTSAYIAFPPPCKMLDSLSWKRAFYIILPWEGRTQEQHELLLSYMPCTSLGYTDVCDEHWSWEVTFIKTCLLHEQAKGDFPDTQQNSQVVDGVWHDDKLKTIKCWSNTQQNRTESWSTLCWALGWIS